MRPHAPQAAPCSAPIRNEQHLTTNTAHLQHQGTAVVCNATHHIQPAWRPGYVNVALRAAQNRAAARGNEWRGWPAWRPLHGSSHEQTTDSGMHRIDETIAQSPAAPCCKNSASSACLLMEQAPGRRSVGRLWLAVLCRRRPSQFRQQVQEALGVRKLVQAAGSCRAVQMGRRTRGLAERQREGWRQRRRAICASPTRTCVAAIAM